MEARRLALPLVVLVYLALDFANPLMPGAVSFGEASVEIMNGDRARVGQLPAPAEPTGPIPAGPGAREIAAAPARPAPETGRRRPRWRPALRRIRLEPPPPGEDH
jgi:hypothetical protein